MANWIARLSPAQRLQKAREKSSRLVDHITELVRVHESNRIVIYTDTLARQIPRSLAANAYNDFKNSLFYFEVIRLCALWDRCKEDRESIPTVITLLDDATVQSLVERRIENDWTTHPVETFGKQQACQIADRFRRAQRVSRHIEVGKKLDRLRRFRDKFLAHSLSVSLPNAPRFGDEARLLAISIEIVHRIYLATHNSSFMFENSIDHARRCAQELWNNCAFAIPKRS